MNDENEDYWQEPPNGADDELGEFDPNEGCSHCGYWQCKGCSS